MSLVHSGASASIPTGADLNWRSVWPGQWTCDNAGYIWADSLKGGQDTPAQVRGWGYLTGGGSGALGLNDKDAERIQAEVGRLLAAAPDLLTVARMAEVHCRHALALMMLEGDAEQQRKAQSQLAFVNAAIAKATTPDADTQVGIAAGDEPKNIPTNGDSQ